jgi:endonuclease YncB( thermonuclease family)
MLLGLPSLAHSSRGASALISAVTFVGGMLAGAALVSHATGTRTTADAVVTRALDPTNGERRSGDPAEFRLAQPAQVLRVIDGDTFEARVRVWPGMDITTKVRLRGIDAPEFNARCAGEMAKAEAARTALAAILAEGGVGVARVSLDKYGGRVVADASTRKTVDVSAVLLSAGLVRRYAGGRRETWC